ncbi:MAG: 1-acyl-sn-glycerol-3-phosphate acyltransferase [Kordiimonadales bacterium]|nr:MAG: 1-acyl-sn-glycerol-3-phosphate acyltransferase [Kordiimonadales bacterium]
MAGETIEYGGFRSNLTSAGWTKLGIFRCGLMLLLSIPILVFQAIMIRMPGSFWWFGAGLWHRTMCRILGIEVRIIGEVATGGPILFAANHTGWLDIIVLGGRLKNASFVAKSEMASWGFVATMCRMHKTVFINRSRRTDSKRQAERLSSRVQSGDSLILFPEGTSTHGVHVSPFKSSLFSVAERADEASDHSLRIQPVTVAYSEINGMPVLRSQKPLIAWLGDVELFDHLRQFMALSSTVVTLEFHEPLSLAEVGTRKELAKRCEEIVCSGLERAHRLEMRMGPQRVALLPPPAETPVQPALPDLT